MSIKHEKNHPSADYQVQSGGQSVFLKNVSDGGREFVPYHESAEDRQIHSKLIKSLSRYTRFDADNIIIFADQGDLFESIVSAYITQGNNVLICGAVESRLSDAAEGRGATIIRHFAPSPFDSDAEGIIARLKTPTRLVYLANPDHNTGVVYSSLDIARILERFPETVFILDECSFEFSGISLADLVSEYENLAVLRSLSIGPGTGELSGGYLLTSAAIKERIRTVRNLALPSAVASKAAISILDDLDKFSRRVERVRETMTYLSVRLRGLGISSRMTSTAFLLMKVADPQKTASFLKQEGIDCRTLGRFPGLSKYISVDVSQGTEGAGLVGIFENMPRHYYLTDQQRRRQLVLRRRSEYGFRQPLPASVKHY
jgi:histidinol-phosphate aminotransferase